MAGIGDTSAHNMNVIYTTDSALDVLLYRTVHHYPTPDRTYVVIAFMFNDIHNGSWTKKHEITKPESMTTTKAMGELLNTLAVKAVEEKTGGKVVNARIQLKRKEQEPYRNTKRKPRFTWD